MHLRLATLDDIPAILTLIRNVIPSMHAAGNHQWGDDYPNAEVFAADIAANQLWLAEIDGSIAGVAALTTEQYPEYEQVGWDINEPAIVTHRLAVDPAFRGRGVAVALMQQADIVARQSGTAILRVDTNIENLPVQQLLPKLGYTLAGPMTLSFRPGQHFLCYEKRLPQ